MALRAISLVVFFAIVWAEGDKCKFSHPSEFKRLEKDVLCKYDRTIEPIMRDNFTVQFSELLLTQFSLGEWGRGYLSTSALILLSWSDGSLSWKPDDYNGIDYFYTKKELVWTPDFFFDDQRGMDPDEVSSTPRVMLQYSGIQAVIYLHDSSSRCTINYKNWPYDTQNCSIYFLSTFNMSTDQMSIDTETHYTPNSKWELIHIGFVNKSSSIISFSTDKALGTLMFRYNFNIHFRRLPGSIAPELFVVPFALIVTTITMMTLDLFSKERTILMCVNLLLYLCVIEELFTFKDDYPEFYKIHKISFVLTIFAIMGGYAVRNVITIKSSRPQWLTTTTNVLKTSPMFYALFLSGGNLPTLSENETIDGDKKITYVEWYLFGRFFNSLSLYLVVVAYGLAFFKYYPIHKST